METCTLNFRIKFENVPRHVSQISTVEGFLRGCHPFKCFLLSAVAIVVAVAIAVDVDMVFVVAVVIAVAVVVVIPVADDVVVAVAVRNLTTSTK